MSYLEFKRMADGFKIIYCKVCNKIIAQINEDEGTGLPANDCNHYRWVYVSSTCYYEPEVDELCDYEYVKKLKERHLVKIDSGTYVYLLVPNEEE